MKDVPGKDACVSQDDRFAPHGLEMLVGGLLCAAAAAWTLFRAPSLYAVTELGGAADRLALLYFLSVRSCLVAGMVTLPALLSLVRGHVGTRDLALQLGLLLALLLSGSFSLIRCAELRLLAPALYWTLPWCWNWRGVFFLDLFVHMLVFAGVSWGAFALARGCARVWGGRRKGPPPDRLAVPAARSNVV